MDARPILLLVFSAICVIVSLGLGIRLSTPHVTQGRMVLKIVLAFTIYAMVKTCLTALAILAM